FISFFFQAEDGIRDRNVTGVQTCALPIFYFIIRHYIILLYIYLKNCHHFFFSSFFISSLFIPSSICFSDSLSSSSNLNDSIFLRSEERRVGKECSFKLVCCSCI